MRYREEGNVHKDFHLATDTTIRYVLSQYGLGFLKELFRRTAHLVYKEIYEALKKGDCKPLVEHLTYFLKREEAVFRVINGKDEVILEIEECPAVKHLKERGREVTTDFCLQTALMNEAWSEGSEFNITTFITGEGSCRQIIRRKHASK